MKKLKILLIFCLVFLPFSNMALAGKKEMAEHVSGQLLVKLENLDRVLTFNFSSQEDLDDLISYYSLKDGVSYVEPNYTYMMTAEPLDTFYTQQTYLSRIEANKAWDISTGSAEIVVAVIDTGVDLDHADLVNNIWTNTGEVAGNGLDDDGNGFIDDLHGWDFVNDDGNPEPNLKEGYDKTAISHGTVVAGIAAAEGGNSQGIAGVSWHSKIMALQVLDEKGVGATDKVASAIDYAVVNGADVVNLSFVGSGKSKTLEDSIRRAYQAGVMIVAAAGNEVHAGQDMDVEANKAYPVCHDGPSGENWVMGVASVDNSDMLASFSNYGSSCVDLVAPGLRLFSTNYHDANEKDFKQEYSAGWTGTSVSAPQVAGAAALIMSIKPELSLMQVQQLLKQNTINIDYANKAHMGKTGGGLLNVYLAMTKTVESQPIVNGQSSGLMVTAAGVGGGPHIKQWQKNYMENEFFAFDSFYRGGLSVAFGDVNGDGIQETVVGLGPGTHPWFRIFDAEGEMISQFLAYHTDFRGGVEVAVGDIDGDGIDEIITAAGKGGGPHVRVFKSDGSVVSQFFAFDTSFRGGLEVAVGDVDGDFKEEIIIVAKSGHTAEVKIFEYTGEKIASIMAGDKGSGGSLHVAAGDTDGDNVAEVVVGFGSGDEPKVKIFNLKTEVVNEFLAYGSGFRGGVWVAVGDIDGDHVGDIICGAGNGGGPHVRVFNQNGGVKLQFFAYDKNFRGGVRVAAD